MSEAPEKIRTNAAGNAIVTPHPVWDTDVEYIRADVAQAMVAAAREDALREAAEKCHAFMLSLSNDIPPVEHTDIDTCIILRSRILALIPTAEGEAD